MKLLSPPLKILHWLMGALVIFMLINGYFTWHKAVGVTLLFLFGLRIILRAVSSDDLVTRPPTLQERAAYAGHILLYFLMFAIPATGLLRSLYAGSKIKFFGLFEINSFLTANKPLTGFFRETHAMLTNILWAVVAAHILAALYHHFILKDETLRRMLFMSKRKNR